MRRLQVTGEIWKEGNMFTSYCPELDVASCGRTTEEAKKNLIEVIEIHLEETEKAGTLKAFLEEAGFCLDEESPVIAIGKEMVDFERLEIPVGVL